MEELEITGNSARVKFESSEGNQTFSKDGRNELIKEDVTLDTRKQVWGSRNISCNSQTEIKLLLKGKTRQ